MAARVRALQVAIAVVNLVIFALVVTSLWPFPSGDFNLDLPSPQDVEWRYDAGIVYVTAPFTIDNGGFYDVADLVLSYDITNATFAHIASDEFVIGTIPAGAVVSDDIEFQFDIKQLYDEGFTSMVFLDDLLYFELDVSCLYTAKLISFNAEYNISVPWDALVQDLAMDDYQILPGSLGLDYHLTTSDILSGQTVIHAYLYEGSTLLSDTTDTVTLGGYSSGTLTFTLPSGAVPDHVVFEVQVADFLVEETVEIPAGVVP